MVRNKTPMYILYMSFYWAYVLVPLGYIYCIGVEFLIQMIVDNSKQLSKVLANLYVHSNIWNFQFFHIFASMTLPRLFICGHFGGCILVSHCHSNLHVLILMMLNNLSYADIFFGKLPVLSYLPIFAIVLILVFPY